jgi:bifunctional DNA-binding transcriptional regulator/antitoxin component of YhaV-PrlF toxin-antitoxin module
MVGIQVGLLLSEAVMDSKGRVLIPEKVRKKAGLISGTKLKVSSQNHVVTIRKSMDPEQFIRETNGTIKGHSPVKVTDSLKLKEIWTTKL